MSSCFWISDFSELADVHPDDIYGDWSGATFEIGDILLLSSDDDCSFYLLDEFSEVTEEDLPHIVRGSHVEGRGYLIWRLTSLSYTTQSMLLGIDPSGSCDESGDHELVCELLADAVKNPEMLFGGYNRLTSYPPWSAQQKELRDTTESLWLEEVGATLDWLTDRVTFGSTGGGGGGEFTALPDITHTAPRSGSYVSAGNNNVRNSLRHVIAPMPSSASTYASEYQVSEISEDGLTWNVLSTLQADATYQVDLETEQLMNRFEFFIGGSDNQFAVACYKLYTGSKPDQGYIELLGIDASYNVTRIASIISPSPARYGNFGVSACIIPIDDGADHILLVGEFDNIHVYQESLGWGWLETIEYDTDDVPYFMATAPAGLADKALVIVWQDSTSSYIAHTLYWTGSAMGDIASVTIGSAANSLLWVGQYYIIIGMGGSLYSLEFSMVDYKFTFSGNSQSSRYVTFGAGMTDGKFLTLQSVDPKSCEVRSLDASGAFVIEEQLPDALLAITAQALYALNLGGTNDYIYQIRTYMSPSRSTLTPFEKGAGEVFETGHFHFSSITSGSKIVLTDDQTGITSGGITCTVPTGGEIRFALSFNDVDWFTWNGSANVALTSLADIEVNGYDHSGFEASLQALDLSVNKEVFVAFAMNRPVDAMGDDESPYIENYWYTPLGGEPKTYSWEIVDSYLNSYITNLPAYFVTGNQTSQTMVFGFRDGMK